MSSIQFVSVAELSVTDPRLTFITVARRQMRLPYLDIDWSQEPDASLRKWLMNTSTHTHQHYHWLVSKDNIPVGWLHLRTNNITDRHILSADIYIDPDYRRQGLARQTLRFGLNWLADHDLLTDITRFHVDVSSAGSPPALREHLLNLGFEITYTNRQSGAKIQRYDLDEIKQKAQRLQDSAESKGYHFQMIENGNLDQLFCSADDFFKMRQTTWNLMPTEDAGSEEEIYDNAMNEEWYKSIHDGDMAVMIVSYDQEDHPVGLSEAWFSVDNPYILSQYDTGVISEHWGNQLGITMKTLLLNHLLQNYPQMSKVQYWNTGNAGSNEHMIRINNVLQYQELYNQYCMEVDLDQMVQYLG